MQLRNYFRRSIENRYILVSWSATERSENSGDVTGLKFISRTRAHIEVTRSMYDF